MAEYESLPVLASDVALRSSRSSGVAGHTGVLRLGLGSITVKTGSRESRQWCTRLQSRGNGVPPAHPDPRRATAADENRTRVLSAPAPEGRHFLPNAASILELPRCS